MAFCAFDFPGKYEIRKNVFVKVHRVVVDVDVDVVVAVFVQTYSLFAVAAGQCDQLMKLKAALFLS